ncbi:Retrovirus-related Pol polyprotein from transposon 17.6 [Senna tora]|uniref:Retrovirus-related Pol polyprotein from transposon 17.6 n=1 Tax=Senna tora TaxID=362788 RepID=A0A834SEY8_9FABA|nr:Retrovirus-related Pol polyprotein from transposon 17.6 [Senna tora]
MANESEPIENNWIVFVDGSAGRRGSGVGVTILTPEGVAIDQALELNFKTTNNQAEYEALIAGLNLASELGATNLLVSSDSQLVVGQLNGDFEVKEPTIAKYVERSKMLLSKFKKTTIQRIPRTQNDRADCLYKLASASARCGNRPILQSSLDRPSIELPLAESLATEEVNDWRSPITKFLTSGELPEEDSAKRKMLKISPKFCVDSGVLYKRDRGPSSVDRGCAAAREKSVGSPGRDGFAPTAEEPPGEALDEVCSSGGKDPRTEESFAASSKRCARLRDIPEWEEGRIFSTSIISLPSSPLSASSSSGETCIDSALSSYSLPARNPTPSYEAPPCWQQQSLSLTSICPFHKRGRLLPFRALLVFESAPSTPGEHRKLPPTDPYTTGPSFPQSQRKLHILLSPAPLELADRPDETRTTELSPFWGDRSFLDESAGGVGRREERSRGAGESPARGTSEEVLPRRASSRLAEARMRAITDGPQALFGTVTQFRTRNLGVRLDPLRWEEGFTLRIKPPKRGSPRSGNHKEEIPLPLFRGIDQRFYQSFSILPMTTGLNVKPVRQALFRSLEVVKQGLGGWFHSKAVT